MSEEEIINSLTLGSSIETLTNQPNSPLAQLMQALLNDIIERLRQSLIDRNINTSRRELSQSMQPTALEYEGNRVSIGLEMAYYWKFINYGVNGTEVNHGAPSYGSLPPATKSFKDSILEWIPARSVQLPPQFKTYDSFAFAIMTNVRKRGQAPRPFFEDVINDQTAEFLREPIERLLGKSIEIAIAAPWQSQ